MRFSNKVQNYFKNIDPFSLFILIECFAVVVFLTLDMVRNGNPVWALMLRAQTQFDDYFVHLGFASAPFGTNIYEFSDMACFPPLAYLIYAFFARLVGYQAEDPSSLQSGSYYGQNLTVFILYNLICIVLLIYAVSLYMKKKGFVELVVFPLILIFSYPIIFSSIQRGNSVILAAILIAIALAWKDDPSKVKRELALVLIAVCAGLKIYPAVFGIMYLKEKRWKEAIRLIIYGIVLFFLPFAFFGGTAAVSSFFSIVFRLFGEIHECSVCGFTVSIVENALGSNAALFGMIIQQVYLAIALIAFFCAKTKRAEVLVLCSLITVYVSSNWMYTCVYILPAMLVFFCEKRNQPVRIRVRTIPDITAFILFLIVFSRPFYAGYMFIYGSVIILSTLFCFMMIAMAIRRVYLTL